MEGAKRTPKRLICYTQDRPRSDSVPGADTRCRHLPAAVPLNFSSTAGTSASFPDAVSLIGDAIRDFVWLTGSDGSPIYQNRASARYTGQSTEELRRSGWRALCHPDDQERFDQTWREALSSGDPFELEFRCRRRDGAYRWLLCQATAVNANGREHTHWMATLTDVHRHRLLESELHRAIRHRDEFLATLAHEVRSPLQAIRQALGVAQSPSASAELVTRMHAIVDRQLNQLLRFTEDSLDVSRVRWNAMSLVPSSVTLQTVVERTVESVRPLMDDAGAALEVELLDPECELLADPNRLTQALGNLLSNAVKYSGPKARVHLRAWCDSGEAVFELRDWGCGIEPSRLNEIFDLFTRAPGLAASRPEGLGVGLAVAMHVAQMHGGSIVAFSEGLGKGSKFTLRIPLSAPASL